MEQVIIHVDGDDFFASLARLKHRELVGRPVITGHLLSRGNVVAASYAARAAGVYPGQTIAQAKRLCPDGVFVQVDWELARQASRALAEILRKYSPGVEQVGLDSLFIDYTGCSGLFGMPVDFVHRLQEEIQENLKLGVSAGLAADKAVSAVACRAAKQGGFVEVRAGEERKFLRRCPVAWLPGVSPKMYRELKGLGIATIGDVAQFPCEIFRHVFGDAGVKLHRRAQGIEQARVRPGSLEPEVEVRRIFPQDLLDIRQLDAQLADMAGELGTRLRKHRRSTRYIVLELRYSDGVRIRRQQRLTPPGNADPEIYKTAKAIFYSAYTRRVRLRGLVLGSRHLTFIFPELPFDRTAELRLKWNRVLQAVDRTRSRFPGKNNAVFLGSALKVGGSGPSDDFDTVPGMG